MKRASDPPGLKDVSLQVRLSSRGGVLTRWFRSGLV